MIREPRRSVWPIVAMLALVPVLYVLSWGPLMAWMQHRASNGIRPVAWFQIYNYPAHCFGQASEQTFVWRQRYFEFWHGLMF